METTFVQVLVVLVIALGTIYVLQRHFWSPWWARRALKRYEIGIKSLIEATREMTMSAKEAEEAFTGFAKASEGCDGLDDPMDAYWDGFCAVGRRG